MVTQCIRRFYGQGHNFRPDRWKFLRIYDNPYKDSPRSVYWGTKVVPRLFLTYCCSIIQPFLHQFQDDSNVPFYFSVADLPDRTLTRLSVPLLLRPHIHSPKTRLYGESYEDQSQSSCGKGRKKKRWSLSKSYMLNFFLKGSRICWTSARVWKNW